MHSMCDYAGDVAHRVSVYVFQQASQTIKLCFCSELQKVFVVRAIRRVAEGSILQ